MSAVKFNNVLPPAVQIVVDKAHGAISKFSENFHFAPSALSTTMWTARGKKLLNLAADNRRYCLTFPELNLVWK